MSQIPLLAKSRDRGQERLRRAFLTAMASIVSRTGTILVLLVTVPMTLHHLGPERFGLWMVLSSLAAIMTFADLGIGNGVVNMIAAASGVDDDREIRAVTSSALLMLGLIGAVFAVATLAGASFVDWAQMLRISDSGAAAEAGRAVLAFGLCLAFGVPAGLGIKVQIGLQQGYAANLWIAFGGLLSFIAVLTALGLGAGVPMLVLALFGSQQLAMAFNCGYLFFVQRPDYAPRPQMVDLARVRALLQLGSSFFLLQLIAVVSFRIDALIVARFFGAVEAGNYAVYERLFAFVTMIVTVAITPLWPAYGEAVRRGDHQWVRETFRRSMLYSMSGTFVIVTLLVLFHRPLVELWVGRTIAVSGVLILGLAAWKLLEAFATPVATLLNALSILRAQILAAVCMALLGLALKLWLAPKLGIPAIVWSTIVSYSLCTVIPVVILVRRAFRRMAEGASSGNARVPVVAAI